MAELETSRSMSAWRRAAGATASWWAPTRRLPGETSDDHAPPTPPPRRVVVDGVDRSVWPRQTLYLAGHREQADGPTLIAAAALAALDPLAVGDRYQTTGATAEPLAGTIRFRAWHQVGVSVDAWPGLLVLAGRPPSPKSPQGGGFALLTTFGMSDADLTRLARTWSAAWGAAFARVTPLPPS